MWYDYFLKRDLVAKLGIINFNNQAVCWDSDTIPIKDRDTALYHYERTWLRYCLLEWKWVTNTHKKIFLGYHDSWSWILASICKLSWCHQDMWVTPYRGTTPTYVINDSKSMNTRYLFYTTYKEFNMMDSTWGDDLFIISKSASKTICLS
jgi:hypothetical protein